MADDPIQTSVDGEQSDIWSRLLEDRIVFIGDVIDERLANIVIAQLLCLERDDANKDIDIYIQSPGGSVIAGLAIYDTMQMVKPDIRTTVLGVAAGIAAVLASGGAKGKRYAMAKSRLMIHRDSANVSGTPADINRQAREIRRYHEVVTRILAENCGQSLEKITSDTSRDYWMAPEEAVEYGIIDTVLAEPVGRD